MSLDPQTSQPRTFCSRGREFDSRVRPLCRVLLCVVALLSIVPALAQAETIEVVGADGVVGTPGTDGAPPTPGGDGGDGDAATTSLFGEDITAIARGGDGGAGGAGGDAIAPSLDGASGGAGGSGGSANAVATARGAGRIAVAEAVGGAAGAGGSGGAGAPGGSPGADGAVGATGGDASASADAEFTGRTSDPATSLQALADATATDGSATADSRAWLIQGSGSVEARSVASNASDDAVRATASVNAVAAGALDYDVEARGTSTGGGDVEASVDLAVRAIPGDGPVQAHDLVSGSTSGELVLVQKAGSIGVDMDASLRGRNPGGGDLVVGVNLDVFPFNFRGGDPPAVLRLGPTEGIVTNAADVEVNVLGAADDIELEPVGEQPVIWGESQGGDVFVRGQLGLRGVEAAELQGPIVAGGRGRSLSIDNAVGGETTGDLHLIQRIGSSSGNDAPIPFDERTTIGGRGGDATGIVRREGSSQSIEVESFVGAGDGGDASFTGTTGGGDAGNAWNEIELSNDAGSVEAVGFARGGVGGSGRTFASGDGGDARLEVQAETLGDGQDVIVGRFRGSLLQEIRSSAAFGGQGGTTFFGAAADVRAGDGGNAVGRSLGIAQGNSGVDVLDQAIGGTGGGTIIGPRDGIGGNGGGADSRAEASGQGTSVVKATSRARGGSAGALTGGAGRGGDARAMASASGLGPVEAEAFSVGGGQDFRTGLGIGGDASAVSIAQGASGNVLASASHGRGAGETVIAEIVRDVNGGASVGAFASGGPMAMPMPADLDGFAQWRARPTQAEIAAATQAHAELEAFLDEGDGSVAALAQWGARGTGDTLVSQHMELDITLQASSPDESLRLAIFDTTAVGSEFESLAFEIEVFGIGVGERVAFDDLAAANAFFATLLPVADALATPGARGSALKLIFDVVLSSAQQTAGFGIAVVVVPEPGSALLIGLGLAVLARRRAAVG